MSRPHCVGYMCIGDFNAYEISLHMIYCILQYCNLYIFCMNTVNSKRSIDQFDIRGTFRLEGPHRSNNSYSRFVFCKLQGHKKNSCWKYKFELPSTYKLDKCIRLCIWISYRYWLETLTWVKSRGREIQSLKSPREIAAPWDLSRERWYKSVLLELFKKLSWDICSGSGQLPALITILHYTISLMLNLIFFH